MFTRTDIINYLILGNDYKSYLEIGVRNPNDNFNRVICESKIGVDPDVNAGATYKITSDEFFLLNKNKFDIVFIDGLHLKDQVLKDIANSLNSLNDGGTIVCHDCLPNFEYEQIEHYDGVSSWTGTVWKAIATLRMTREDLFIKVVDTDFGCGIIKKGNQTLYPKVIPEEMNWEYFLKNRNDLMNVIAVSEFKDIF